MDDHDSHPHYKTGGANTVTLFLGLFLLVLAFFILLVSISTVESVKSRRVMDSLSSTFSAFFDPTSEPRPFTSREGDILGGQRFLERISGVFATGVRVTRTEILQPGQLMRVTLDADQLFVPDETTIRPVRHALLDRIVAALNTRPPGARYEMEFIMGSPAQDGALPIGQTRETARAGGLAREMIKRGAPADSLSIGIRPGDPSEVTIWFRVADEDRARLRFDRPDGAGPAAGSAGQTGAR